VRLYIAIPIPTPDRWRFLRDPAELPPGHLIIIAAARRFSTLDAVETIAGPESANDSSTERAVFVFLANRRKGSPPEPVVTETRELADIMRGRCSDVVEVRLTVRGVP
jgi:hypothetical protein